MYPVKRIHIIAVPLFYTLYKKLRKERIMNNILIIDDDIDLCNLMKHCVSNEGFSPLIANNKQEAYSILNNSSDSIYLVILDILHS
mgnify:FL=1